MSQFCCSESAALLTCMSFTDVAIRKLRLQKPQIKKICIRTQYILFFISFSSIALPSTVQNIIFIDFCVGGCCKLIWSILWGYMVCYVGMWSCHSALSIWDDVFVTKVSEHSARSLFSQKMNMYNQHVISQKSNREAYAGFLHFHLCRVELSKS